MKFIIQSRHFPIDRLVALYNRQSMLFLEKKVSFKNCQKQSNLHVSSEKDSQLPDFSTRVFYFYDTRCNDESMCACTRTKS